MQKINTITIKVSLLIIAALSIVSACTMNGNCCEPEKTQVTEIEACCLVPASSTSPLLLSNVSPHDSQDACSSCNCNTLPKKGSSALSSGQVSLKIHVTEVKPPKQHFYARKNNVYITSIILLNAFSSQPIPLRI